jgi:hypothetical protein
LHSYYHETTVCAIVYKIVYCPRLIMVVH